MGENTGQIKVLFVTGHGYTIPIYLDMLEDLNKLDGIHFTSCEGDADWEEFDVILLMYNCCDKFLRDIRKTNPQSRVGVVDPRKVEGEIINTDFAVVQGIEEENWLSDYFFDIFRYDFHPTIPYQLKRHIDTKKIVIGYHGNKVHLHTMYPYLTTAIEALANEFDIEFRAYYNIKTLGHVEFDLFPSGNVDFKEIQWSWDIFQKSMPEVDIGVVPNLIPIKHIEKAKKAIESYPALFNEHSTDNLVRYKGTSNIGRLYPFAQLGVPVVADLYPSSCNAIEPGVTGFFGGSAGMWYRSLHKLASSADLRQKIGQNMQEKYLKIATPQVFNENFLMFLQEVCSRPRIPVPKTLAKSHEKLDSPSLVLTNSKIHTKRTVIHSIARSVKSAYQTINNLR